MADVESLIQCFISLSTGFTKSQTKLSLTAYLALQKTPPKSVRLKFKTVKYSQRSVKTVVELSSHRFCIIDHCEHNICYPRYCDGYPEYIRLNI